MMCRDTNHTNAHTHHNDADIFYRVISQEFFYVMFCQGIKYTEYGRYRTETKHNNAIPNISRAKKIDTHFNDPENTNFYHHTRHHCRCMRRCSRVSFR